MYVGLNYQQMLIKPINNQNQFPNKLFCISIHTSCGISVVFNDVGLLLPTAH
jgi:hypothetical protein